MINIYNPTKADFDNFKIYYLPLLLFSLLEVVFYGGSSIFQTVVSVFEYIFLSCVAILNIRKAIFYFVCFSLLSFGAWSYVVEEVSPENFWGLRILGISANLLFSLYLTFVLFLKFRVRSIKHFSKEIYFAVFFYVVSTVTGLVYSLLSVNYFDNFIKDCMIFFPLLIYPYLIFSLNRDEVGKIFTYCVSVTVLGMLFSLITGIFFEYGSGLKFILLNSFGYMIFFILPFCRDEFSKYHYYLLILAALILLISGDLFVGGKFIILIFLSLLWYFLVYRRNFLLVGVTISVVSLSAIFWVELTDYLLYFFTDNILVQYKLSQVISIAEITDFELLSASPTSIGNIVAELGAIFQYFTTSPVVAITGLGFGGGVPDALGLLAPMAGPGLGYAEVDVVRDNFVRMHLPLFEFFLKLGVFGGCLYLYISAKQFMRKNIVLLLSLSIILLKSGNE